MILDDIAFRGLLNRGESVVYVAHVHVFKVYPQLFKVMLFGFILPALGYYLLPPFQYFWAAWGFMGLMLFSYRLAQWYLDAWVVTNMGVIDQEWNSVFDKSTTRIDYGNIEGITSEIKGFWPTILRFGTIQIEHMSGQPIVLEGVSNPRKLERFIQTQQQLYVRQQNFSDQAKLKDLLTSLVRSANK